MPQDSFRKVFEPDEAKHMESLARRFLVIPWVVKKTHDLKCSFVTVRKLRRVKVNLT